jgi:hypothetical protein
MAPRNFAEDGAVGAGMNGSGGNYGGAIGGVTMNDPGPGGGSAPRDNALTSLNSADGWETGSQALTDYTKASIASNSGVAGTPGFETNSQGGQFHFRMLNDAENQQMGDFTSHAGAGDPGAYVTSPGALPKYYGFAEGGAIPEDDDGPEYSDAGDSNGSPEQDDLSKSLESVAGVLAFGRKLHGLGGLTQTAEARMPSRPGNQSESGRPPIQPMPGPLPPTQNPFGQRQQYSANLPARPPSQSETGIPPLQPAPGRLPPTDNPFGKRADNDSDGDEGPGAIDTDEDTA